MEGGILDCVAQRGWMYVVIIILAIIAFVWLTCAFSTSACESQWFGRLCRVLPWSSCGKNNAGSHPTIELNIEGLERLSLSPRQTNDVSRYVVVNAEKKTFHPGRRWDTEFLKLRPEKNLADSDRRIESSYNEFLHQHF